MHPFSRRLLCAAALGFALALAACFEPPVLETLDLRFLKDGSAVVTSRQEISPQERGGNPALTRRLAQVRRDIEAGTDPWGQRFAALEPAAERFAWEKQLGEIRRGTRSALLHQPENLRELFRDTSLDVSYEVRDGVAELAIVPGTPARATRRQQQLTQRTLDAWSSAVAVYLEESADLWAYLEDRPDRARPCLGAVLADVLDDEVRDGLEPLEPEEKDRVEKLRAAMEEVVDVLVVPDGEDHSPDEISHLVYDPFPARLTVSLPGPPLEAPEGFESTGDGGRDLTAIGPGLWEALRSLEGRWLTPDPALLFVKHSEGPPLDLDAVLAVSRRAEAPRSTEIRRALEERLRPAPLYRVTFTIQPGAEPTEKELGWGESR